MPQASNGYFAISKETTPGTAITVPTHFYPVEEVDISFENEFIDAREIRGSRQAYLALDGRIAPEVTAKGLVYPGGAMGLFLRGLIGGSSSAAEGSSVTALRHTFANAPVLPSYTIERADARSGEGGILCERAAGCKMESFSLNAAFNELVEWEATWQAIKKPVSASPVAAGSVVYPTMNPMVFRGASVEVDDTANQFFKSINMEITNTLERQEALNGSQEAYRIFEGGLECSISGTMVFEDLTFYNKLLNSTEFKLELILTGDIADAATTPDTFYQMLWTFDRVKVQRHSLPFVAGEIIEADIELKTIFDATDERVFLAEMINLDDSTEYDA